MLTSKKMISLAFTLLLGVGSLAACSSNQTSNDSGANVEKKKTPVPFSVMTPLHTPEVPSDKVEKLLEEKTGVELNIQWVPFSNYEEKVNSAFATGSLPEAIYLNNDAYLQFKEAIRDDQFWEVGAYIDDYPNLKKLNEQVRKNTAVDGKVYAIYQGRPASRQGLIFRKDWADNLGLTAPTTIDEFHEMARAFTEDDPDGNGQNDTFGLTDRGDFIFGAFDTVASWHGTPNGWGVKGEEVLPRFMFPEFMDTMNFFKELREKGYINQDFPVTSKEDQQSFFKNGKAGMYVGAMGDVQGIYQDAVKINPEIEFDVQNQIKGPNGEFGVWSLPGYGAVVLFSKSAIKTEERLKEILHFFDYLMSPEGSNLLFWGVEGEHYTVKGDSIVQNEDSQLTDREVKPYQAMRIGEPAINGTYEALVSYEVREKAEKLILDNENHLIQDPTAPLDSSTFIEKGERLNQMIKDATYKYILGQIDEQGFEKVVDEWRKTGGDDVIKEFSEAYHLQN